MIHLSTRLLLLALALTGLVQTPAQAQDGPWAPPRPAESEKDWIRLTSGEWLWGTIDLMRDETLEFDSEELDGLKIDWADIAEIRSARYMTYVLVDHSVKTGTSTMRDNVVRIATDQGEREIPRNQVLAILEGKPTELNFWSAKVGVDYKARSGNTDQVDFGTRLSLKRDAPQGRLDLRYQGNYSKTEGVENIRNHRANLEWKIFVSRKFFITPINAELFQDKFQNIQSRATLGAGIGYFLTRTSKTDWFVELGGGYQETRYVSVQEGEEDKESNGSIPFRTTIDTELSKMIDLEAEYGVQVGVGSGSNTLHHTFILFEFELTGAIDFTASFTWDHQTRPTANAEGITPNKDDTAMGFGLAIDI